MKKKRAFTLLEIMIVIFLIGLIGSVIGYNMKGSMDEGKAFKTEQAILQLQDVFELEMAKGHKAKDIEGNPVNYLSDSGIVKNPEKLLKDGWGKQIKIEADGDVLTITSKKLDSFRAKKLVVSTEDEED